MVFINRLIFLIATWAAGILFIYYREKIVRIVGKSDLAEKYLGLGGTYNMWVLIGAALMVVGVFGLLGELSMLGI